MDSQNCIFCKILDEQLPAEIIAQTDNLIVIKDKYPKATHHYLIISKQHIENVKAINNVESCLPNDMFSLANKISKEKGIDDFKLVINNGLKAGQIIFHLHMHFLSGKKIEQV